MKVRAVIKCEFEIEYEDYNDDITYTRENICMTDVKELIEQKVDDSIEFVNVIGIMQVD